MKTLRYCLGLLPLAVLASSILGQETSRENPFPEIGNLPEAQIFDVAREITLTGVVTQSVTRPVSPSASVLYFRLDGAESGGTRSTWTVKMPATPVLFCDLCLIDDFQPEMAKLAIGMTIRVVGHPAKDQSHRVVVIPQRGSQNIAGVVPLSR